MTSVASSASALMASQIAMKFMTFSLNQVLLQYATAPSIGMVQLIEFVIEYIFFVSTESIRLAIPKICGSKAFTSGQSRKILITNISVILPLGIFILLGIPFAYLELYQSLTLLEMVSNHKLLISLVLLSILIQLLTEPYYDVNQYLDLNFSKRAKIESLSSFTNCIGQLLVANYLAKKYPATIESNYIYAYIIGQVIYSLTLLIAYSSSSQDYQLQIPRSVDNTWLEPTAYSYFKSVFLQQIFKQFLTEGDHLLVNRLLPATSQGYYALIENYGSLFARLVFLPIEEAIRINTTAQFESHSLTATKKSQILSSTISNVSQLYFYIIVLLLLFAPSSTKFLVHTLFHNLGASTELVASFKVYWYYLPLLAINGVAEALFTSSFHDTRSVKLYSRMMLLNSAIFFIATTYFIKNCSLGLNGVILGNSLNMLIRIVFCCYYLSQKLPKSSLSHRFIPFIIFSFVVVLIQNYIFPNGEVSTSLQFLENGTLGLISLTFAAFLERSQLINLWKSKTDHKKLKKL